MFAGITSGGDVFFADSFSPALVVRARFGALDTGVRFLAEGIDVASSAGNAPVMVNSASSLRPVSFPPRRERVVVVLVTNPSLSSLKLLIISLTLVARVVTALVCCFCGATVGFATRDATLARGGRGIVADDRGEICRVEDVVGEIERAWLYVGRGSGDSI